MTRRLTRFVSCVALAVCAAWVGLSGADGPRFRRDDPLRFDLDTVVDASHVVTQELSQFYDFLHQTFVRPGDRTPVHAVNVNTMDEVPDSMWFMDRISHGTMTLDSIVRGPDSHDALVSREWVIVGAKNSGLQPGFRAVLADDPTRQVYQVEFDPPEAPELATGAELIGTTLYYALGYHVVENYLVAIDPQRVTIDPKATIRDEAGRNRPFTRGDLAVVLQRAARRPDGGYRGLASKFAAGEPRGAFRYYGTRPDDPNDIHPHEHRRELRGARVFAAWVAHDDSRANNTLDMLEGKDGAKYLRHYMFDFGSIMGSATIGPNPARSGHEYLIDRPANLRTLYTLGLAPPAWARRNVPAGAPAAGGFTGDDFVPADWKPEYPNPAFDNMLPDDAFWAARRVAAFTDEHLRAIVAKAQYTDPAASAQIVRALIERRDAIARTWLAVVTPLIAPALAPDGTLRFSNAAVDAGVSTAPEYYELQWSRFDNVADRHDRVGQSQKTSNTGGAAPPELLTSSQYIAVSVSVKHPDYPHWAAPVEFYFRRQATGWTPVGLVRQPREGANAEQRE